MLTLDYLNQASNNWALGNYHNGTLVNQTFYNKIPQFLSFTLQAELF